jgi:hypothetical protein
MVLGVRLQPIAPNQTGSPWHVQLESRGLIALQFLVVYILLRTRRCVQQQTKLPPGVDIWNECLRVLGCCDLRRNSIELFTASPVLEEVP